MNPRRGENPPLISNSRSQIWRGVRSHDGHSREWAFSSAIRSGGAVRSVSSPPCGAIIWLIEAVKSLAPRLQVYWQIMLLLLAMQAVLTATLCGPRKLAGSGETTVTPEYLVTHGAAAQTD